MEFAELPSRPSSAHPGGIAVPPDFPRRIPPKSIRILGLPILALRGWEDFDVFPLHLFRHIIGRWFCSMCFAENLLWNTKNINRLTSHIGRKTRKIVCRGWNQSACVQFHERYFPLLGIWCRNAAINLRISSPQSHNAWTGHESALTPPLIDATSAVLQNRGFPFFNLPPLASMSSAKF
jgi:hypothetical protein